MARTTHTRKFKLSAVHMVTDKGLSVQETPRQLGFCENSLSTGLSRSREQGKGAVHGGPVNATP